MYVSHTCSWSFLAMPQILFNIPKVNIYIYIYIYIYICLPLYQLASLKKKVKLDQENFIPTTGQWPFSQCLPGALEVRLFQIICFILFFSQSKPFSSAIFTTNCIGTYLIPESMDMRTCGQSVLEQNLHHIKNHI